MLKFLCKFPGPRKPQHAPQYPRWGFTRCPAAMEGVTLKDSRNCMLQGLVKFLLNELEARLWEAARPIWVNLYIYKKKKVLLALLTEDSFGHKKAYFDATTLWQNVAAGAPIPVVVWLCEEDTTGPEVFPASGMQLLRAAGPTSGFILLCKWKQIMKPPGLRTHRWSAVPETVKDSCIAQLQS